MKIVLYDPADVRPQLLPFTYTRPVGALRVGIDTIVERWRAFLEADYYWQTESYLEEFYPPLPAGEKDAVYVAGNIIADERIVAAVAGLGPDEVLCNNGRYLARRGEGNRNVEYEGEVTTIDHVYDLFVKNGDVLEADFSRITAGRKSAPVGEGVTVIGDPSRIFVEEGGSLQGCVVNTIGGPIYIGAGAVVMEGCCLRGGVALCAHAQCNMGTKVYGPTTLGPYCKVGGELNNVVMLGYSNKAHDGFLGNAVIGEWCNLGAGTVASNLKNDYAEIKLWNYPAGRFLRTGLQFCGLIMGDHSKSAINTSFNTATTVGVGCNIISEGMPRVFIPSFLKGGTSGFDNVNLNEFFTVASRVMARRGIELSDAHKRMYKAIFDFADKYK